MNDENAKDRAAFLAAAEKCVCHDRNDQYGDPEDNFRKISKLWSDYLAYDIEPTDVAIMMTLMKIARISSGKFKADSYVDAIGYLACGGEIDARNAGQNA